MVLKNVVIGLTIATCCLACPMEAARRAKRERRSEHLTTLSAPTTPLPFNLQIPKGWQSITDKDQLPATVELVYIGSGKGQFSPSINLATEATDMPQREYVALAQRYHESQVDTKCHSLGLIETPEGKADLLQIDRSSQWGDVRFLQAAIVKDGKAYVITATCLLDEYPTWSRQFLQAIQSFMINEQPAAEKE